MCAIVESYAKKISLKLVTSMQEMNRNSGGSNSTSITNRNE